MNSSTAPQSYSETASYTYIPTLDGLRAFSILLVMLGHFLPDGWVPGGFGVTVFFFISGFLISRQLTYERDSTGTLDFIAFYMRRITRLMPALAGMVLVSTLLFLSFGGETNIAEVASALLYGANYYDIYAMYDSNLSGIRHPFIILWSLALEEHFYVLFPVFFALLYPRGKYYIAVLIALLIAALAWRLYLWDACNGFIHECGRRGDYRLHKASDTRFASILYGVLLTAILARGEMGRITALLKSNGLFICSLLLLGATFSVHSEFFRETYRYSLQGLALVSLFAAIMFNPSLGLLRTALSSPPLVLIGKWSYSLYLYHWVGLMVGEELVATHRANTGVWAAVIVTTLLSLGSYYFIERPALKWRKQFGSHAK